MSTLRCRGKLVLVCLWLSAWAGAACADTVVLENSDRLTGEILKLERNRLSLKTGYAGIVNIDWHMIKAISSRQPLLVEAQSGLRLQGIIDGTAQELHVTSSTETMRIPSEAILSIRTPVEEVPTGLFRRMEGSLNFGYSVTRGNSKSSQSSLGFSAEYRGDRHKVHVDTTSLFSRQTEAPATSRHFGSMRYDFYVAPRTFTFALAGFERDGSRQLDLRSNIGGGFGMKVTSSGRAALSVLGGLTFVNERFKGDFIPASSSSGEGLLGLSLEQGEIWGIHFKSKLSLLPNTREPGRYRITMDSELAVPITGRLSWTVHIFDHFDNRPPLDVLRNDYGMISSLGVAF